jgi:hypothetical protein
MSLGREANNRKRQLSLSNLLRENQILSVFSPYCKEMIHGYWLVVLLAPLFSFSFFSLRGVESLIIVKKVIAESSRIVML